jgi:hypothetical protein
LHRFRKIDKTSDSYEQLKSEYIANNRAYISLLEAKKTRYFACVQHRLANSKNAADFYRALRMHRPKYPSLSNEENVKPECFAKYFADQFNLYEESDRMQVSSRADIELDRDFSLAELDLVIDKLARGKATGCDNIPNETWKSLSLDQRELLLDSLNLCWNTCNYPDEWSKITICPIYKKGDDTILETIALYLFLILDSLNTRSCSQC